MKKYDGRSKKKNQTVVNALISSRTFYPVDFRPYGRRTYLAKQPPVSTRSDNRRVAGTAILTRISSGTSDAANRVFRIAFVRTTVAKDAVLKDYTFKRERCVLTESRPVTRRHAWCAITTAMIIIVVVVIVIVDVPTIEERQVLNTRVAVGNTNGNGIDRRLEASVNRSGRYLPSGGEGKRKIFERNPWTARGTETLYHIWNVTRNCRYLRISSDTSNPPPTAVVP